MIDIYGFGQDGIDIYVIHSSILIAQGTFGKVFTCHDPHYEMVAAKVIDCEGEGQSQQEVDREIKIMEELRALDGNFFPEIMDHG